MPFAIETGMLAARGATTTLRVLTKNTGTLCDIEVQTPYWISMCSLISPATNRINCSS